MTSSEAIEQQRRQMAELALELATQRGEELSLGALALESGLPRAQLTRLFADQEALFDEVAELWMEPHIAIMEEVVQSDLPSNRMMYEFFVRRFRLNRERFHRDPDAFALICEMGAARFEKVRSFVDLADHYLCEIIAHAQADGFLAGLEIDEALSLINQIVSNYTFPDALLLIDDKLSEEKLARIIDTIFAGLSGEDGGAGNVLRLAARS